MNNFLKIHLLLVLLVIQKHNGLISTNHLNKMENNNYETVTLGGGCFWCIEAVFSETKGVVKAVSGYSGGVVKNPSYREVTTGRTGHAEVVQVTFDPAVISFENILTIYFRIHDPTTLNRQGADIGTQYRSVIFYHSTRQKEQAEKMIDELNIQKAFRDPIVTRIEPVLSFYEAEEYHQQYFKKNPGAGYCNAVIRPKLDKFRIEFNEYLREK